MIRVLFIVSLLCFYSVADDYFDKNASKITKYDLGLMQQFDKLIYQLSDQKLKELDIDAIYNFICLHKRYILDYSLAKVSVSASTGIDDYDYVNESERDKKYSKASIQFSYPLFDPKTTKDIKNKKIDYNFKILDEISKYNKLRNQLIAKQRKLKFNRLVQIKEKLQVKKGVIYLDEKVKTMEKILDLQNDILDIRSNLTISKANLLNYVKPSFRSKLKEMLK
jgi:hypothetical protein